MAYIAKLNVINSTIGFKPYLNKNRHQYIAAPTLNPVNPASVIGVSQILLAPNLSYNPFETL